MSTVFKANESALGKPNFGLIHIDPEQTALAFQAYLNTASKLTGVSLDDISLGVNSVPTDLKKITLVDLLERGMRLFDAIVWLTAGKPTSHPLELDPALTKESIPSLHDVARAVFYCYFMLVTQARYPVSKREPTKPRIPNFLKSIMGMDSEQHVYVERVCTFEPQKFDPAWARHVKFAGFGQEVLSRFGLGVAGYRMFGPFSLYAPKPDLPDNLRKSFDFASTVARAPATWDLHPLTRSPNVLQKRGNLNKNLGNLILDVFTKEQIDEMAAAKVIFEVPKRDPTHINYTQWSAIDDVSGSTQIFM